MYLHICIYACQYACILYICIHEPGPKPWVSMGWAPADAPLPNAPRPQVRFPTEGLPQDPLLVAAPFTSPAKFISLRRLASGGGRGGMGLSSMG